MAIDVTNVYPYDAIADATIDGQAMVWIPKFYVKYGTIPTGRENEGKKAHWISEKPLSGFHVYPAFVKDGAEIAGFYIGAYEAYNAGSSIAGSASGKSPWVNITNPSAISVCNARNTDSTQESKRGWHLQNIYEVHAINLLQLIEWESPDAQAKVGTGNVSSSAAVATGNSNAVWRGIHEWWGNVWEHVDGLKTDANGVYQIFSNQGDGTYVSTGVTNPGEGWITEVSEANGTNFDLSDVFLPSATNGTESNGTYGDYHWTGKSTVLYRSGSWDYGSGCGSFTSFVYNAASGSGSNVGFRLAKYGPAES